MSNWGRFIRLIYMDLETQVMFSANSCSILKVWGRRAVAVLVRLKALAPYAMIELVLPGGSVMALLLWLYRRRKNGIGFGPLPMRLFAFLRLGNPPHADQSVQSGVRWPHPTLS